MSVDQSTEVWRPIPGFDEWYEVSDFGRIRSYRNCHRNYSHLRREFPFILKCRCSRGDYPQIGLRKDSTVKTYRIHVLVLLAFVGPRPDGMVARHLNDDKSDNRLVNLCWGTESENREDATRNGRAPVGSAHGNSKLTESKVRDMRAIAGILGRRKISDLFGVSLKVVCRIIDGEDWKHVECVNAGAHAKGLGRPSILSERDQRIVRRLYDFVTQDEIADLMGVSQAAISKSLERQSARNGDWKWQRQKRLA